MPNPITEYEREQQKKSIIKHTHQLILERKGIKNITVDDIIRSACMGKSTFYSIFESKEICFCEVLETHMKDVLSKADSLLQEKMTIEERTTRFFHEVYLAKDSIISFINPTAIEVLFRKLPPEYNEKKQMLLSGNVIHYAMNGLRYGETQAETLNVLFDCIDQVVTNGSITEHTRGDALNYLVKMMINFFETNQ